MRTILIAFIAFELAGFQLTSAQTTKPAPAPAPSLTALSGKWEDIDQRFVFLTVELSSTEASLNAVNRAILVTGHQQSKSQQQSQSYQKGSEQMDRNGGGPIPWQDFYGKTAESFYYHPGSSLTVDSKSSSVTIVGQSQKQTTIQANSQGDQTQVERPPQFDYIYRANADAQKRADAEVAKLGGQVDQLQARRKQLEAEQSTLWCKIALRALETRELSDKPIYRFEAKSAGTGEEQAQQLAAIDAGAKFMRKINALVSQTQTAIDGDQAAVYSKLAEVVKRSRSELKTNLLMQDSLQMALDDDKSAIGQFAKAAKRLEDSSQNLSDAYGLARDGDNAGDIQRKLSFRGAIQQMTMDFAATVLTADQTLQAAVTQWKITVDTKKPVPDETTMWIVPTTRPVASAARGPDANTSEKGSDSPRVDRGSLKLISAKYGTGSRVIDVTAKAASMLKDGGIVAVSYKLLGDPAPGADKYLTVRLQVGTQQVTLIGTENSAITIKQVEGADSSNSIRINAHIDLIGATYGIDRRVVEIRDIVAKAIRDKLHVPAFEDDLSVPDPAYGATKNLAVTVRIDGEMLELTVQEHSEISIGNQ